MVKCTTLAQNYTCEIGLLCEIGEHIIDQCSIMHIWHIYKLATKRLKVKTNHKCIKIPQSQQEKL